MITKATITKIKELSKSKFRRETSMFVAEGEKLCLELIKSSICIKEVYVVSSRAESSFYDTVKNHEPNAVVENISSETMSRISQLKTPTPYLIVAQIPKYDIDRNNIHNSLSIALDSIQDPGNMGTIIRIADWFGIKDIFCSKDCVDAFSAKVVQATMGAISRVKIHYINLAEFLSEYDSIPIYGTFLDADNIYNCKLSTNGIIVMGNEGNGISKEVEKLVNSRLFIPTFPESSSTSESLNVAVATSIVVAEFRRCSMKNSCK